METRRSLKDFILLYLKGIGMGAADVVPGVSGGTIAFISGIYEELIRSIREATEAAQRDLLKFRIKAFIDSLNWSFLITLFAGIITSIALLSKLVLFLLENHPIPLWSFFFGLIVASTIVVYSKIGSQHTGIIVAAIAGAVVAFWITTITPTETPDGLWFILLCGAIAICAMILPGISGSFILLLMGKYQYILNALQELKISVILTFIGGCIIGLAGFTRFLDWLLSRYHDLTVAILAGFMAGSLNKVWPWKEALLTMTDRHGKLKVLDDRNLSPLNYEQITGNQPELVIAIILAVTGFITVFLIERNGSREKSLS
jgi:putative membrane protein